MLLREQLRLGGSPPSAQADLDSLTFSIQIGKNPPRQAICGSGGVAFYAGLFDRDMLKMIQHEEERNPLFAREGLLLLASLQGTRFSLSNEEEPGKMFHELRDVNLPDVTFDEETRDLVKFLGPLFGGNTEQFTSYVSADATGEFVRAAHRYLTHNPEDTSFLHETIHDREGNEKTFEQVLIDATQWIADTITFGPLLFNQEHHVHNGPRLLGWQSASGTMINQQLRDSTEANHFPSGELVNPDAPQYETGMQAVAYEALIEGAKLFPDLAVDRGWRDTAENLARDTLTYLLTPSGHFAMGADTDPQTKELRRNDTECISIAQMLDSMLLADTLTENERIQVISTNVEMLFDDNFWTQYGVRTEGIQYWDLFQGERSDNTLVTLSPYHGPSSVWPILNGDLSDALLALGLIHLSKIVDDSIHNAIVISGSHLELFHVGKNQELGVDSQATFGGGRSNEDIYTTQEPSIKQGWSITNERRYLDREARRKGITLIKGSWQAALEAKVLSRLSKTNRIPRRIESSTDLQEARQSVVLIPLIVDEGTIVQANYLRGKQRRSPSELPVKRSISQPVQALLAE